VLKIINLEEGMPTVEQARQKMLRELELARRSGHKGVKLIHGYGSSGVGGEIRLSIGRALQEMKKSGDVTCVIYGEDWSVAYADAWKLMKSYPALKKDSDLGRKNRGITVVWF
jgi:ribosomal protein S9